MAFASDFLLLRLVPRLVSTAANRALQISQTSAVSQSRFASSQILRNRPVNFARGLASSARMPKSSEPNQFMRTSGANDSVWVHLEPYSKRPQFSKLEKDIETDVCIIGSGISGISVAEQCVRRGLNVVLIEARDILSGESRAAGHGNRC